MRGGSECLLRHYLKQRLSKAKIAARLHISSRPVVARKVDAFRGMVQERLSQCPTLSAVRLLDEIRAAAPAASKTQPRSRPETGIMRSGLSELGAIGAYFGPS